jgi:hypothetical protein
LAHYISTVNFTAEQNALPAGLDVLGGKAAAVAEATLEKPCPALEVSGFPFHGTEGIYEYSPGNKTGGHAVWYQKNHSVGTNWIYYIQNTSRWAIGGTLGSRDASLYVPSTDPSPDFAVSSWMAGSGTQTKRVPLLVECATHYHWECTACPKGKFAPAGAASCTEFKAGIAKTPATPWKLGQAWTGSYRLLSGGPVEGNMGAYDGHLTQLNLQVTGIKNVTGGGTNVSISVSWNELTLGCTGQYVASGMYKYDASDLHSFNIEFKTGEVYYDGNTQPNSTECLGSSPIVNMTLAGRISEDSYDFQGIIRAPTAPMKGAPSSIYASCDHAQKYNEGTECMDEKTHKFVPSDTKGAICLNHTKTPAPPTDLNLTCSDCANPKFAYIGMFHVSRNPIRAKQLAPSGNIPLQTPSCSGPSLLLGDTCEFGALPTIQEQRAGAAAARPSAAPTTTVPASSQVFGVPTAVVGCIAAALAVVGTGTVAVFRRRHRRQVLDAVSVSTNEDADGQAPGRYSAL